MDYATFSALPEAQQEGIKFLYREYDSHYDSFETFLALCSTPTTLSPWVGVTVGPVGIYIGIEPDGYIHS
jgi:hypothetical protein